MRPRDDGRVLDNYSFTGRTPTGEFDLDFDFPRLIDSLPFVYRLLPSATCSEGNLARITSGSKTRLWNAIPRIGKRGPRFWESSRVVRDLILGAYMTVAGYGLALMGKGALPSHRLDRNEITGSPSHTASHRH